jgi:hypothetical protein
LLRAGVDRGGEHGSEASDEGAAIHSGRMVAPDEPAEQGRRARRQRAMLSSVAWVGF